ncbi:MAG: GNAT family N-acetyltransferase, partial [Candidatus Poribacteria bacterium]
AIKNGNQIGECVSVSVGEFCNNNNAQDWFFTQWLGVEQEEQGKGFGKYLLQRTFWEMKKIGYENAIISTNIKNYRAQLFYTNFGYKVVDTGYCLVKKY